MKPSNSAARLRRVQQVTEGVYLIDGQEAGVVTDVGHGWLKFWMASKMYHGYSSNMDNFEIVGLNKLMPLRF